MQAGRLRHRIELQSATETRNEYGEATASWSTYATVWAAVEPLRGAERYSAQQAQAEEITRVVIRFRDDVSPKHRVKYGGRYLYINSVINPRERSRTLELMCTEAVQ